MDVIAGPILKLIVTVVDLYVWIIVIGVVLSWLTAFKVVNTSNRFVYIVNDFIYKITEPALRPIRNILPVMGGFDLSPVALILILILVQDVLINLISKVGS
mgnify:FL=1